VLRDYPYLDREDGLAAFAANESTNATRRSARKVGGPPPHRLSCVAKKKHGEGRPKQPQRRHPTSQPTRPRRGGSAEDQQLFQSLRRALRSDEPLDLLALVSGLLEVTDPRSRDPFARDERRTGLAEVVESFVGTSYAETTAVVVRHRLRDGRPTALEPGDRGDAAGRLVPTQGHRGAGLSDEAAGPRACLRPLLPRPEGHPGSADRGDPRCGRRL
jgi:hypothetical protein